MRWQVVEEPKQLAQQQVLSASNMGRKGGRGADREDGEEGSSKGVSVWKWVGGLMGSHGGGAEGSTLADKYKVQPCCHLLLCRSFD